MDKRIPMRTCIGCREAREKKELLRIVAKADEQTGEIRLIPDPPAVMDGRGAYLCRNKGCFETARKRRGFERAFRIPVSSDMLCELEEEIFKGSQM